MDGVAHVDVDLVPDGVSTIRVSGGDQPLNPSAIEVSLGQSAVYAVVSLIDKLTQGPISQATATLNPSRSPRPYLDMTYQLLNVGFALVPVLLALYLLSERGRPARRHIGLTWVNRDLVTGTVLAALIGLPGLVFYIAGRGKTLWWKRSSSSAT